MSSIFPSSGTSSTSSSISSTATSAASLEDNYELFLSLLTTQIQNQDPLDPMDAAEYTKQLVQYSTVEQGLKQNQNLERIIEEITSSQASAYVSYIGQEVSASGSQTVLSNGAAEWDISVTEDVTGTVEIKNSAGVTVFSDTVELSADDTSYKWDGSLDKGGEAAAGTYSVAFSVKNGEGNKRSVSTDVTGVVDELNLTGSEPTLKIGNLEIPISAVTSVRRVS
ncbi:MAG: flagellar hook assembly protein FlgD [Rhodobacteraceae bacterium]|nr:flagellar hook assembly protein FlgD [Paracoccaceae bacterium]